MFIEPEKLMKMKFTDILLSLTLPVVVGGIIGTNLQRVGIDDVFIIAVCFCIGFFGPSIVLRWLYKEEIKDKQSDQNEESSK